MASTNALASTALPIPARAWVVRLSLSGVVLLGALLFLFGTSWDIQWHTYIGRDRTLIPPHIVMLTGVTLSGVAALLSVISETILARRNAGLAHFSTSFAGGFAGPLGAFLAGYAALTAAIAFPLDSYWHSLYGIDVAIWAPFHIMFISGMALVALGAAYMFVSAAHLGAALGERGATRLGYGGAIVALATCLGLLTLLLFDAFLGPLYPIMACFLVGWLLVAAADAIPWRWAAGSVTLVYLLFGVIIFFFVPPATDSLVRSEGLVYLRGHPGQLATVALNWPLLPILSAFLIGGIISAARNGHWGAQRTVLLATGATVISGIWLPIQAPQLLPLQLLGIFSARGIVYLLFGILGAIGGVLVGRQMGQAMQSVERG